MKNTGKYVIIAAIVVAIAVVAAFAFINYDIHNARTTSINQNTIQDKTVTNQKDESNNATTGFSSGLKKFSSIDELRKFLIDAQSKNAPAYGLPVTTTNSLGPAPPYMGPVVPVPQASVGGLAQQAVPSATNAGTDYSTTNIQVASVDEPDFLKNDGKYAYVLSQDKLTIIDAYPGQTAKIVSKIGIDTNGQTLQNMFLNKDRLAIFYTGNDQKYSIPQYDYIPSPVYEQTTHAVVIDVSDKENPKIVKDYQVDGNYYNARMIGDYVYFISNSNVDYIHPYPPILRESSKVIMRPDVYYFDRPEINYNFNTITAFNMFGDQINSQTFMVGYTSSLYVSNDAVYMTYQKDISYDQYNGYDRFFKVIVPLLPVDVQDQIKSIDSSNLNPDAKWAKISDLLQNTYNKMAESDKNQLFDKIQKALAEYDTKIQEDSRKTVIEKISIQNGTLTYVGKGEVPGYPLNQYSMDESGKRFRIATTSEYYVQDHNVMYNNVYVLDESLNIVGSLEKVAPDESIYSARFMGDKLYLVTFHRVDPFFVIDLSSDAPKVLGALMIPGYSSFLQPYDETHIIGIGKDVKQNEYGGVEPTGVKVSLFDVSDVSNPVTVDTYAIGGRGTDSEVLSDPKALLFDKEKNLLSIPISNQDYDGPVPLPEGAGSMYIQPGNWKGFYVFGVDPTHGFSLKGKVEHYNGTNFDYSYLGSRSFYIENSLYTVTSGLMKISDLNDLTHEINQIKLDNSGKIIKYESSK